MERRLIAWLAGAACLVWAAESQADQPQPQPQPPTAGQPPAGREHRGQAGQASRPHATPQGAVSGQPRPSFEHRPQTQNVAPGFGAHPRPAAPGTGARAQPPHIPPPAASAQPGAQPQVRRGPGEFRQRQPTAPFQPGVRPPQAAHPPGFASRPGAPALRPPTGLPQLGAWNRGLRGHDRDAADRAWREQHRDWDRNAPWRHDRNWWRGSAAFRLFVGPRLGFFFIPEFGYIAVPSEYEHHAWRAGDRLPQWFWRYIVEDYWTYGLPTPPYGCAWVWVGRDVALIDLSDGYIVDIVRDVY